jgi:hypothetical protein
MDFTSGNEIQVSAAADAFDKTLAAAKRAADGGKTKEAGQAIEKLLATMLVREMTRTLPNGFFGDGPGADTFNGWLEDHLGGALAEGQALGLSEAVQAALIRKNAPETGGGNP